MKIVIDESVLKKNHLKLSDYLYILLRKEFLKNDECEYDVRKRLIEEGIMTINMSLTIDGKDLLDKIDSKFNGKEDERCENLAKKLQALWPSGYKDSKWKWQSNEDDVKKKLYAFFKDYPRFKNVTDEQILEAAKMYVKRFDESGNRLYQKILKYFIVGQNGECSMLADNLDAVLKNETPEDFSEETLF